MVKFRSSVLAIVFAAMVLPGATPLLAHSAAQDDDPGCVDGWASRPSLSFPGKIRVWATCTGSKRTSVRCSASSRVFGGR
jgi:hypothetical protein